MQKDSDRVDFCQISPEFSRDFRGLRIWLPLKLHRIEPFRRNLAEKLDLIEWATEELRAIPQSRQASFAPVPDPARPARMPGRLAHMASLI